MFQGSFQHQLDDKGRLRIPPKFRDELGENPVMMLGLDTKCIVVYRRADFEENFTKRFENADILDPYLREVKRAVFANTMDVVEDKQNRVTLLPYFIEECGMTKKLISVGLMDCFEIWDEEEYYRHKKGVDMNKVLLECRNGRDGNAK
ncbi:MAG: hypothetical protein J1G04_02615 [Clostridiales bacterium]|nr:hypothetical protein [Clostridiales bacterium]